MELFIKLHSKLRKFLPRISSETIENDLGDIECCNGCLR